MASSRKSVSCMSSVYISSDVDLDPPSPSQSQITSSDFLEEVSSLSINQPCGPCQEGATNKVLRAVWFCQNCDEYLCQDCISDHDALKTADTHKVAAIVSPCAPCGRKNKEATSDWYCHNCDENLCNGCKSSHRKFKATKNHNVVDALGMKTEWRREKINPPVTDDDVEKSNTLTGADILSKVEHKSSRKAILTSTFNVKLQSDIRKPSITSSAFLPDGRLLLLDNSNCKVKLFDETFNLIVEKYFGFIPYRMAVYDKNEIALLLGGDQIDRFSVDDDIALKKSMVVVFTCFDVDYISGEKLAVTAGPVTKGKPCTLYVLSTHGDVLSEISKDNVGKRLFAWPRYVTVDRARSRVYVSNWNSDDVCALDLAANNDVIFTYQHEQLNTPAGMAVDQEGNLYICGSNGVHQISQGGQYIKTLLSEKDGLRRPLTISFHADRDIFIIGSGYAGASETVLVFSMTQ